MSEHKSSLFTKLRKLHAGAKFRLEDYHTEIVAQVLRNRHDIMLAWLRELGVGRIRDPDEINVATQENLGALIGHECGSRPDIAIRLCKGAFVELLLIESKIGAKEGFQQLQRYADHLLATPSADSTILIYITRDFETKKWITLQTTKVAFKQTRWFQFYRILDRFATQSDTITIELGKFMKENNMSQNMQFTPIDVLALTNFPAARKMMDATLWGGVSESFKIALGRVSSDLQAFQQLTNHQRYIIYSNVGTNDDFSFMLGYWIENSAPGEYPWVGLKIEVHPKSPIRPILINAMRHFISAKMRSGSRRIFPMTRHGQQLRAVSG